MYVAETQSDTNDRIERNQRQRQNRIGQKTIRGRYVHERDENRVSDEKANYCRRVTTRERDLPKRI